MSLVNTELVMAINNPTTSTCQVPRRSFPGGGGESVVYGNADML